MSDLPQVSLSPTGFFLHDGDQEREFRFRMTLTPVPRSTPLCWTTTGGGSASNLDTSNAIMK